MTENLPVSNKANRDRKRTGVARMESRNFIDAIKHLGHLKTLIANEQACLERLADELNLTQGERETLLPQILIELEQRLPQIITVLALTALLPLIGKRAQKHIHSKGESVETAEDLGQEVIAKALRAIYGNWPRGNVGAWLAMIRRNVYFDRLRARQRDQGIMERAKEKCRRAGC